MVPVIALVGRPNVGKSTLFNRLTHTRDALVADFPGLTRDRKYGQAKYHDQPYILIDTGGIYGDEEGIDAQMAQQSHLAMEEADAVLFLVDARAGLTGADQTLADGMRKLQKPVFVVANKTDGIDAPTAIVDFYGLGLGEIYSIAAAHGRGINPLMDAVLGDFLAQMDAPESAVEPTGSELDDSFIEDELNEAPLSDDELVLLDDDDGIDDDETPFADLPIKLAIVGRPNVGKSTLTNRILGEDRVVVFDMPGTTRDSVYIPMVRNEQEYILIDTAGVRRRARVDLAIEKFSIVKTLQAIEDANVVVLVLDARAGISDQDISLLGFVLNAGRSLVIAVNKWDGLNTDVKDEIKRELDRRLGFIDFAQVHFISALHGSGVGNLFESVQEAYQSATKRISTSMLTKVMQMAVEDHNPPMVRGRRIKLRYAHAGGYNPPRIIVHGNQLNDLPDSYKRYLSNYFRKTLGLMGTPIRFEFKEGDNPFAGRKNTLTLSQQRKRKRLIKFLKKRKR